MAKKSKPSREECLAMLLALQKEETQNPETLKQTINAKILDHALYRNPPRPLPNTVRERIEKGQQLSYQDLRKIAYACISLGPHEISRGNDEEIDGIRLSSFFNYSPQTKPETFRKYHKEIFGHPPEEPDPITAMKVKTLLQKTFIEKYMKEEKQKTYNP